MSARAAEQLLLVQGTVLPKALPMGPGAVQGSMEGSHTSPVIRATWQVPAAEASGQVKLDKDSMHLSAKYVLSPGCLACCTAAFRCCPTNGL